MSIRTGLAIMAMTVLAATAWPVAAQESDSGSAAPPGQDSLWNFYVGGGLGGTKADSTVCDDLSAFGTSTQQDCDDKDVGWKVFLGWQPLTHVAFEGGYVDLGKTTAKGGATNANAQADGWEASALVYVPGLEKIGVYIKGGAYFYEAKLGGRVSLGGTVTPLSEKDTDSTGVYGVGARLPVTDRIKLNIEFQRFLDLGEKQTFQSPNGQTLTIKEQDINFYHVGGVFTF